MIKIFSWTPNLNDGAAICRVHVLQYMAQNGYPIHVETGTTINDYDIEWADIIMIHRPTGENHLPVSRKIKEKGKKLWIDNDDDYLNVPIDHFAHIYHEKAHIKEGVIGCTTIADLVTISNEQLKKTFGSFNSNIQVYPCCYDERLIAAPDLSQPRNKTILWRGSATHNKSLYEFSDAIGNLDKEHRGWEFYFIGDYPWHIIEKIKNNTWYCNPGYMPTREMWDVTRKVRPAFQIVLLTDNQFTKSRSSLALADATTAGALTIARDFEHFKVPGVVTYRDQKDFEQVMHRLMDNFPEQSTETNVKDSWKYVEDHLTFRVVAKTVFKMITELVGNIL